MPTINLLWDDDEIVDSYTIYRSNVPMNPTSLPTPIATGIATKSYIDNALTEDNDFYYRVAGVKDGFSSISSEIKVMVNFTYARYWRIYATSSTGSFVSILEMILKYKGEDISTVGKPVVSSGQYSTYNDYYAFNGVLSGSYWAIETSRLPAWNSVDMGSPVHVDAVDIISPHPSEAPKDFIIQSSFDGVTWNDIKAFNKTSWSASIRNNFILT